MGSGTAVGAAELPPVVVRAVDLADPRWDVAAEAACLDPAERARAERGTPAVRRRRVLVRAALRRVLGERLGLAAADVPLATDRGRPFLPGDPLRFSCSASGDVALLAVTAGPGIGIDVQQHSDDEARAAPAEGWLAAAELAALAALPAGDRLLAVTRAWTQKEAVLKAEGTGLTRPPRNVMTTVTERGTVGRLSLVPVRVPDGYVASLALGAPLGPGPLVPGALHPGGRR